MKNGFEHTKEAIKQRGEVFTPPALVKDMLDKLPPEVFIDPDKTFLDNSCGNGQFLSAVLKRKMDNHISHKQALTTIYGVELDITNAAECRKRLLMDSTDEHLKEIVNHNIITADALDPNHPGWAEVGFYWDTDKIPNPSTSIENGEFSLNFDKANILDDATKVWDFTNAW